MQLFRSLFRNLKGNPPPQANKGSEAAPAQSTPASPAIGNNTPLQVGHGFSERPDELNLTINRPIVPANEEREYTNAQDAAHSPLAVQLLALPGVSRITLRNSSVLVGMETEGDWEVILKAAERTLTNHFSATSSEAASQPLPPSGRYNFGFKQVPQRDREEQMAIVQSLFEQEVNPAVAAHGGQFTLVDVKDNTVYVRLGGGCQGCGMADVTLKQGVEQRLKQVLPEMVALVDVTDHASGANPYFTQSKK